MCAIYLLFQLNGFFLALQCRLECEPGYVAQRTPLITCVNGEYAKGCHYLQKLISQILSIRSFRFLSTYHMDVFFDQNGWTFGNILKPMPFSIPNMILQIFGFLHGPLNHNFFGNILEFLRILRFLKKYREKCIKHEPFGKLKKAQGRPRLHADAKKL